MRAAAARASLQVPPGGLLVTGQARRRVAEPALLALDPGLVGVDERLEQRRQLARLGLGEALHVERRLRARERLGDLRGVREVLRAGRVGARDVLRRASRWCAIRTPRSGASAAYVGLDGDAVPDGELDRVAEEHLQPGELLLVDRGREPDRVDRRRTNTGAPSAARTARLDWHSQRSTERPPSACCVVARNSVTSRWSPRSRTRPCTITSGSSGSGAVGLDDARRRDLDRLLAAARAALPDPRGPALVVELLVAGRAAVRAPARVDEQLVQSFSSAKVSPNADGTSWSTAAGRSSAVPSSPESAVTPPVARPSSGSSSAAALSSSSSSRGGAPRSCESRGASSPSR